MIKTPNEFDVLVLCSGLVPSKETVRDIKVRLSQGLDFNLFIRLMIRHRLCGPVYQTFDRFFKEDVPLETFLDIKSLYQRNVMKSLENIRGMIRLTKAFNAKSIEHIFLKGPCLSHILYGNPSFRHAGDVDVIIPGHNVKEAMGVVEKSGYRQVQSSAELTGRTLPIFKKAYHHMAYMNERKASVELHWDFSPFKHEFPLSFDEAYSHRRYLKLNGVDVPFPGECHTLLYLFYHGAKHQWQRVFWLKDLADYIQTVPERNLRTVWKTACEYRMQSTLIEGLSLAHDYFDTPWPEEMASGPSSFSKFMGQIPRILQTSENKPAIILLSHLHRLLLNRRVNDQLSYISKILEVKHRKKLFNPGHRSEFLQALKARFF